MQTTVLNAGAKPFVPRSNTQAASSQSLVQKAKAYMHSGHFKYFMGEKSKSHSFTQTQLRQQSAKNLEAAGYHDCDLFVCTDGHLPHAVHRSSGVVDPRTCGMGAVVADWRMNAGDTEASYSDLTAPAAPSLRYFRQYSVPEPILRFPNAAKSDQWKVMLAEADAGIQLFRQLALEFQQLEDSGRADQIPKLILWVSDSMHLLDLLREKVIENVRRHKAEALFLAEIIALIERFGICFHAAHVWSLSQIARNPEFSDTASSSSSTGASLQLETNSSFSSAAEGEDEDSSFLLLQGLHCHSFADFIASKMAHLSDQPQVFQEFYYND